jgi:hypothetical protein
MCVSVVVNNVQGCAKGDRKVYSECESIVWLLRRYVPGETEVSYCEYVSMDVSIVQECAWGERSVYCKCVIGVVIIVQDYAWGDKRVYSEYGPP